MKKQMGISLIELMIGMAIGIIVVGGGGALFVSTLRSNLEAVRQQNFEQSMWVLLDTIAAGLRRAGFSNSTTSLASVPGWTANTYYYTNGTCLLYTYVDTTLPVAKQQYFGYKLDTATGIMYSYQADALVDCATNATWAAMTDLSQITISQAGTGALFSSPTNPRLIEIHFIAQATGLTTGGTPVQREFTKKVYMRNS